MTGTLYGVGLGPGDPELVTVKAARVISAAEVIAYHSARHGRSIARGVAAPYLRDGQIEEQLVYPLTVETTDHPGGYAGAMADFYTASAARLAAHLDAGRDVVVLAEGDPMFYGSYMHMHKRLCDRYPTEVIPGVTSVSAASAVLRRPLVEGEETLTILPGTLPEDVLAEKLAATDSAAVLKLGRTFGKVRDAFAKAGKLDRALYVERATWDTGRTLPLSEVDPDTVPYFSLALLPSALSEAGEPGAVRAVDGVGTAAGGRDVVGEVGTAGEAGTAGEVGTAGQAGTAGEVGEVGTAGQAGTAGEVGEVGTAGEVDVVDEVGAVGTVAAAGKVGAVSQAGASRGFGAVGGLGAVGEVVVVGLGPAGRPWLTPEAQDALATADDLVGYTTYLNRVPANPRQRRHLSDNQVEAERAAFALDLAKRGRRVAVVSSGDPGVFAMATAVLEVADDPLWRDVPVRVLPGVTAAHAVAARAGAPLGHDFCTISLSDRLKPWEVITGRLSAAAQADFAIAVYNPASKSRTWQLAEAREILLRHRSPETPVVVGRDVGGPEETVRVTTLADLDPATVDMRCLLIIGSSHTRAVERPGGRAVLTPRSYGRIGEQQPG